MPIITATELKKHYHVSEKQPGFLGTLKHFANRQYRTVEAVKGATFSIEPGEMVGFLGPNGAGKTTVLKMLTGLIHPTAGSCEVSGHVPFKRRASFLKDITLVMGQKQQLLWDLPALDSLRINAAIYGIPDKEFELRVGELAEMLTLDEQLKKPVRKLSLGERMKAELLAALVHRPSILFLDEPTLGLDVNAQVTVRQFLRDYNETYNATILLTSHYMADITALCERVLMIHEGNLIYDGSLDSVIEQFAPYREVKLELNGDCSEVDFSQYGEVESCEGRVARMLVKREDLKQTVNRLLADLDVADLTIADPPIEEIIGRVFKEGSAGGAVSGSKLINSTRSDTDDHTELVQQEGE
jgi:ABC-2 type transport system ATP-binding protein